MSFRLVTITREHGAPEPFPQIEDAVGIQPTSLRRVVNYKIECEHENGSWVIDLDPDTFEALGNEIYLELHGRFPE